MCFSRCPSAAAPPSDYVSSILRAHTPVPGSKQRRELPKPSPPPATDYTTEMKSAFQGNLEGYGKGKASRPHPPKDLAMTCPTHELIAHATTSLALSALRLLRSALDQLPRGAGQQGHLRLAADADVGSPGGREERRQEVGDGAARAYGRGAL